MNGIEVILHVPRNLFMAQWFQRWVLPFNGKVTYNTQLRNIKIWNWEGSRKWWTESQATIQGKGTLVLLRGRKAPFVCSAAGYQHPYSLGTSILVLCHRDDCPISLHSFVCSWGFPYPCRLLGSLWIALVFHFCYMLYIKGCALLAISFLVYTQ